MGWSSGSELMSKVITAVENSSMKETDKVVLYEELIVAFEEADCDTLDECVGESNAFDSAMLSLGFATDDSNEEEEFADE